MMGIDSAREKMHHSARALDRNRQSEMARQDHLKKIYLFNLNMSIQNISASPSPSSPYLLHQLCQSLKLIAERGSKVILSPNTLSKLMMILQQSDSIHWRAIKNLHSIMDPYLFLELLSPELFEKAMTYLADDTELDGQLFFQMIQCLGQVYQSASEYIPNQLVTSIIPKYRRIKKEITDFPHGDSGQNQPDNSQIEFLYQKLCGFFEKVTSLPEGRRQEIALNEDIMISMLMAECMDFSYKPPGLFRCLSNILMVSSASNVNYLLSLKIQKKLVSILGDPQSRNDTKLSILYYFNSLAFRAHDPGCPQALESLTKILYKVLNTIFGRGFLSADNLCPELEAGCLKFLMIIGEDERIQPLIHKQSVLTVLLKNLNHHLRSESDKQPLLPPNSHLSPDTRNTKTTSKRTLISSYLGLMKSMLVGCKRYLEQSEQRTLNDLQQRRSHLLILKSDPKEGLSSQQILHHKLEQFKLANQLQEEYRGCRWTNLVSSISVFVRNCDRVSNEELNDCEDVIRRLFQVHEVAKDYGVEVIKQEIVSRRVKNIMRGVGNTGSG